MARGHAKFRKTTPRSIVLLIILLVVLILAVGGGGWGHSRYGAMGWSPVGIILLVLAVLYFTGRLHL
jgi:hypothetical protein